MRPSIAYNFFGTLANARIPAEIEAEFAGLRQQGEAGYREYDAKMAYMIKSSQIGIFPLKGSSDALDRSLQAGYSNSIYSHASSLRLNLVVQALGWGRLISSLFGTLDHSEIYDKTVPESYRNLAKLAREDSLELRHYVTHKPEEAKVASHSLQVFLIDESNQPGGTENKRIEIIRGIEDLTLKLLPLP
jgi:phosphoglycolate phosphatase-like HAD superfamily hydrolase